jgi:cobalt-precorrin-5B (C1)-methyltransferase
MKDEMYVIKEGKKLRCGYTTGSCATGASKAAALMLETGEKVSFVEIDTPAGIRLKLEVKNPSIYKDGASCAIVKDAGDDPDVTDGMEIYALVKKRDDGNINIDGGEGIGRIKRKGLFGQVGEAAINPVPRDMIEKELREVSNCGYDVCIYAPLGEEIAKKTYNKNIGIEGGISIIGTKGIVYPMSEDALKKTIYLETDAIYEKNGDKNIVFVLGNYGENVAKSLNIDGGKVKVSNYIGDSLLYAYNKGFKSITLIGHIGKFSKLSIGAFNTHSKICDVRIEAFVYYLALRGAPLDLIKKVNDSITTEEALNLCIEEGYEYIVKDMTKGCEERIKRYLKDEDYPVKVIIYSMERGVFL